jgi:putative membrane-bound dehydrogenase-like protein
LLLEVDGGRPGSKIAKSGQRPHIVDAKVRVRCEVAPVTHVQLIANGRVIREVQVPASAGKGGWIELEQAIEVDASAWIAARAYSLSPLGTPDAESHTNPVYVYLDGRAPYDQNSLDSLVAAIDGPIAIHQGRKFPEQAQVIAYFEHSRDILMKIREAGGAASTGHPSDIARATGAIDNLAARTHSDEELKAFLKPVPPKSPSEALETFETIPGFQLELLAAEPLVFDPISAAIDEDGNLYVTQMRDYPYHPKPRQKPLGSVRMLRDTDGDGRYDEGHLFADELLWAGGVACWKGGVFVAAPPDIWYFKDTDGDHQADVRRKVFTGFGEKNQQAMVNNLKWGLDHKIYGSTAGNGGDIRPADKPEAQPVSVNGRDFRFDPVSDTFESITGTIQFGNTFDDWGNRFLCSESTPLHHVVLEQKYLERNPYVAAPAGTHNIAGGAVPIFRISPIERWRQIRSSRRIAHGERDPNSAGASHHVIDAAAGVTVYTGSAYPAEFYGNVFVGDAQNNLVHRRRLTARGLTFDSTRADEGAEFVRSSDNWFRPVNFVNAPDGTLYVLDMSREILEAIHIPLDVMQHLDLKSGRATGRIYRMAPTGFRAPPAPRLSQATTEELVALLAHPNGWHRETARRLLLERQDKSAVEPLRRMLLESTSDMARLGALYSLAGLKAVSTDDLKTALDDRHPGVREHALRLAESRIELEPELLERAIQLSRDADARVRFQAAFSLGETRDPRAIRALAELAVRDGADAWMSAAILSSAGNSAEELLIVLLQNRDWIGSSAGRDMSRRLAFVVGARNQEPAIARLLDAVAKHAHVRDDAELQSRIVLGLADGLRQANGRLAVNPQSKRPGDRLLSDLLELSLAQSRDAGLAEATRAAAIRLLGVFPYEATSDALFAVFTPANPEPVQIAAIGVLAGYNNPQIADRLLENWRQATPALRSEVARVLLSRQPWALRYLSAVESNAELASVLDPVQREQLIGHKSPEVRELAKKLLGNATLGPRRAVIDDYRSCLTLPANPAVGEKVFDRACAACHQINGKGHAIGPNLASSSREPETLLTHILDPSQYVLPQYVQYTAVDNSGRIYQGMLAAQTSASVTLIRDKQSSDTLLRSNLEELVSTGKSLMPEGIEQQLSKQDLADLIAWLHSIQAGQPMPSPKLDIGSEPGIIEP